MATETETIAEVLADPDNRHLSAEQVAERVLGALTQLRQRPWRYIVIAQDRDPKWYDLRMRFGVHPRRFFPTYAKGPFHTLAEARGAAGRTRRAHHNLKVMTARVFDPEDNVDTDGLEEVSA